jgi:hypothetical protein
MNYRDIQVYLILSTKIIEPCIINKIINITNTKEKKEALDYHFERWETVAGNFFHSVERSPFTGDPAPYSYVLDSEKYIYEGDRNMSYFNETGISYQSRELLLATIKNESNDWPVTFGRDIDVDNLSEESKKWRLNNDKMYSILSRLITDSTKKRNSEGRKVFIE